MSTHAVIDSGGSLSAAALRFLVRATGVSVTVLLGRVAATATMQAVAGSSAAFDLPGEIGGALVTGVTLAWIARRARGTTWSRIAALALVAFVSVAAVMFEGSAFAPTLSPLGQLAAGLPLQLLICVAAAGVAVAGSQGTRAPAASSRSGLRRLMLGAGAAAVIYVVAYLVTGALNYLLVTGPYYETHAGGLVTPEPSVVLAVALGEGLMLALAAIPLARALPGSTRARAISVGLVLWLLGGVGPLLQAATLPDVLRIASAVEILFQKVPLGMGVAWFCTQSNESSRRPT